ncbi:hypothetical protein PILCRDRAFT_814637 [Piloderma croceum F 1598]|uniref:Uncharacterized protein n=1 Tax=Piloderma croceum (strain F 1598) TaxID=765440 RepID=A0A0C3G832_PILCF|nr:hypothetical protein PILCRDRAFT_814637 [Piloderma croceum F 1598]
MTVRTASSTRFPYSRLCSSVNVVSKVSPTPLLLSWPNYVRSPLQSTRSIPTDVTKRSTTPS